MIAVLAAAAALAASPPATAPVFVVMGQSNAALGAAIYTHELRRTIGPRRVVVCAVSGRPLRDFERTGPIYQRCLRRLDALNARDRVAGVFFFQGESDTGDDQSAATWRPRFARLVTHWRRDTSPHTPFVVAQIAAWPTVWNHLGPEARARWETVRTSQASLRIRGLTTISTGDLRYGDTPNAHFTRDGYRTIGQRFARAWLALTSR